jgi:hypothetical protein
MKIIKLALIIGAVYFGYGKYQEHLAIDKPFIGKWKSNTSLTMKEFYKVGIPTKHEQAVKTMLGKATITVSNTSWDITLGSQTTPNKYEIISRDNDCFQIDFKKSNNAEVCIVGNNMYVSSDFKGAYRDVKSVYSRI